MVFRDRIIGNTEFQKTVPYVTARPNNLRPSCREVKNDVWKYLQIIVIVLYAACGHLLDNHWARTVHLAHSDSMNIYIQLQQSEDCFYYCSERNNVVVLFGTLKVQSFVLTEVSDCGFLIVVTSSTFLKRKDLLTEKSS